MRKRIFTDEETQGIIYDYTIEHLSQKALASKYHTDDSLIRRVLDENHIRRRTREENGKRQYNINHHFFDVNHQTREMAYVLGLLSSDGCISTVDNQIYIELQRQDKELLIKVNQALENERPVKDYVTARGYENSKLYFYSKKIKVDLAKYHVIPNKTYRPEYIAPDLLQPEYTIYYILGMFDGDGSIKASKDWVSWQIDTSSKSVAEYIQASLKNYGIDININTRQEKNVVLYRCMTYKQANLRKLYSLFYSDSTYTLFLKRKYQKFTQLLK